MGKNVEIKAKLSEPDYLRIHTIASNMATEPATTLIQTDTFFAVPQDRLKLREFADGTAELIAYQRADSGAPKLSSYTRTPIAHPHSLKQSLLQTIGIRGIVKKHRQLFLHGQTRIHLDDVEGLGKYLELEVVLRDSQTQQQGDVVAQTLMETLGIQSDWLVSGAYIDILENLGSESPLVANK